MKSSSSKWFLPFYNTFGRKLVLLVEYFVTAVAVSGQPVIIRYCVIIYIPDKTNIVYWSYHYYDNIC